MRRAFVLSAVAILISACGGTKLPPAPPPVPPPPPVVVEAPPPPAGDPAPVTEDDVTFGTVHGIKVIVRRIPGAEFAATQLCIRGGSRNWNETNAGVEHLAIAVATSGGTSSLDKVAFSRKLAGLGADLSGGAGNDFSTVDIKAPLAAWDDTFRLMTEVFLSPAMPAAEVELQRQQRLASLHHEAESPDGRLWTLQRRQIFAGHPYANRPGGSLETVAALKAEDLAAQLVKLREANRLVVVAVGDLDAAHVFDLVRAAFGQLPAGSYVETPIPPLSYEKSRLVTEQRTIPTNYVSGVFVSPGWKDADFVAGQVATSGLSHRLWDEVRTKRNLSYSVGAWLNTGVASPFGQLTVTAVDPNAAMKVMLDEAKRLQTEPLSDAELAGFKSVFLTWYLQGKEVTNLQAAALAQAEILGGDWRLAKTVPERVRAVTAADVQTFAKKYYSHLQAAVLGDPSKVDNALFTSF